MKMKANLNMNSKLCHEGHHLCRSIHGRKISLDLGSVSQQLSGRGYAAVTAAAVTTARKHDNPKVPYGREAQQREADREFFADLLSSAATKRDAKAYLARLQPLKSTSSQDQKTTSGSYVNVGNLFRGSRAAEMSPTFTQGPSKETEVRSEQAIHIALVKLKDVATLSQETLSGVAETLVQLNRLSLSPCVVIDAAIQNRQDISIQLDLLVDAINKFGNIARRIDNVFCTTRTEETRVGQRKLLLRPLQREHIPVVAPIAYNEDEQRIVTISASQAMITLTKEFAGLTPRITTSNQFSLDRVITIDAAGGIPNAKAADGRHVFLNLEQEYKYVQDNLTPNSTHLENLTLLNTILRLLPPTSSGLMTTYAEASNHGRQLYNHSSNVGTRRQKNSLIHNLLTDKPAHSSSLPLSRLSDSQTPPSHSSFVKRGMPITLLPNPYTKSWHSSHRIQLTDPRINLPRLVHLIEDSFNRKLDLEHYLARVNNKIAGIIIAGDYEGGAILTWETPDSGGDPVPYLDKFAVLKKSQGAGGVADIVFNAMVRSCFPHGVCWRSRRDNPVNKWYFERSRGTWKVDGHWCMFWTGEGVESDSKRFEEYVSVCRGVKPSWADRKPAD